MTFVTFPNSLDFFVGPDLDPNCLQGSHTVEKYLNLKGFLEKSLKIKYALKSP